MPTELMATVESLERQVEHLPLRARGRFLLAYAERLAEVFELFEVRARGTSGTFRELLGRLWTDASRSPPGQTSPRRSRR
jgi:hypothetical protein